MVALSRFLLPVGQLLDGAFHSESIHPGEFSDEKLVAVSFVDGYRVPAWILSAWLVIWSRPIVFGSI